MVFSISNFKNVNSNGIHSSLNSRIFLNVLRKISLLLALAPIIIMSAKSQAPPCYPEDSYITYRFQNLTMFPPYSLDMPYDVLLAYVALDTVSHYGNSYEIRDFLKGQTYNDTLRKIMRHYYQMIDFDPIKYNQTDAYFDISMHATLSNIDGQINDAVLYKSPYPLLDYMLCRSHYILHVKAKGINIVLDTNTSGMAREVREISYQVLDTIKGKNIPYIINSPNNIISLSEELNPSFFTDTLFVFQYSPFWGKLIDEHGQPWIQVDSEYVVFLTLVRYCHDSTGIYCNLRPVWPESVTFGMYPLRDGLIYDPLNELGLGIGLTISEFKQMLRNRINEILSY